MTRRVDPAHLAAQIRATSDDMARGVLRGDHQLVLEQMQFLVGELVILWRQSGWQPPPLEAEVEVVSAEEPPLSGRRA